MLCVFLMIDVALDNEESLHVPLALLALQAQLEAQKATQDFQRATEVLRAAKETISLAEQRLLEEDNRQFDSAWQEMLNHATQRVRGRKALHLSLTRL